MRASVVSASASPPRPRKGSLIEDSANLAVSAIVCGSGSTTPQRRGSLSTDATPTRSLGVYAYVYIHIYVDMYVCICGTCDT